MNRAILRMIGEQWASAFIGGVISKYVWIRPELNSAGLKNLAKGGLWATAVQIAALESQRLIEEKLKFGTGPGIAAYFITVLTSVPASVLIGRKLSINVSYGEAAMVATLSTITTVFTVIQQSMNGMDD